MLNQDRKTPTHALIVTAASTAATSSPSNTVPIQLECRWAPPKAPKLKIVKWRVSREEALGRLDEEAGLAIIRPLLNKPHGKRDRKEGCSSPLTARTWVSP